MKLIEAQKVRVSFDDVEILQDVDLELRRGKCSGWWDRMARANRLLLKILVNELKPSSGSVRILDEEKITLRKKSLIYRKDK